MQLILNVIFFVSGATGLVYEVVWGRMLAASLGSTVVAASIVMGMFMGGLALGARFFGMRGDAAGSPLRLYGLLEVSIGLVAVLVSHLLPSISTWYPTLARLVGDSGALLLKMTIAAVFLFVPVMLMGGTLPVLVRHVVRSPSRLGNPVGTLYGLNTLGAFVGCLFAGFWAMEFLGLHGSTWLAAFMNISIGLCCWALASSSKTTGMSAREEGGQARERADGPCPAAPPRWFLLAYAVSGATGLAYEVLWIRLLSNTFIGTSYGFSAMLGTCLGGMALGSLAVRKRVDTVSHPMLWFGGIQLGIACWALFLLLPYDAFPVLQDTMNRWLGISLGSQVLEMATLSAILILAPSMMLGALFPLAARIWGGGRSGVGRNVGSLYTVNTLGCVVGSLIAGLVFLPILGMRHSFVVLGMVNGCLALYAFALSPLPAPGKRMLVTATGGGLALLCLLVPSDMMVRVMAHKVEAPWRILYYTEEPDNSVMILQHPQTHVRRLMTSFFQYIGDTTGIMTRVQSLQAHLPMLLHENPERVLFVGMGTGITPGAAAAYSSSITCCEISPGVIRASRFFAPENGDVLHNSRIHLVQEDGRQYLLKNADRYDLIIGDLYNAALAGMGNLYSREYYSLCLSRLEKGGMMCQWISMKDLPERAMKGVMATFGKVFPYVSLWCATPDILAMVGSAEPQRLDMARAGRAMARPPVRGALHTVGLDSPVSLLSHFLMNREAWNTFAANAPVVTDDRPYIEYSIPRSLHYLHYREDMPTALRHVDAARTALVSHGNHTLSPFEVRLDKAMRSESHLFRGYADFLEAHWAVAHRECREALSLDPGNMDAGFLERALSQRQQSPS